MTNNEKLIETAQSISNRSLKSIAEKVMGLEGRDFKLWCGSECREKENSIRYIKARGLPVEFLDLVGQITTPGRLKYGFRQLINWYMEGTKAGLFKEPILAVTRARPGEGNSTEYYGADELRVWQGFPSLIDERRVDQGVNRISYLLSLMGTRDIVDSVVESLPEPFANPPTVALPNGVDIFALDGLKFKVYEGFNHNLGERFYRVVRKDETLGTSEDRVGQVMIFEN